ncbi:RraA family protein [Paenibacillus sp. N3.4]|uniref:RraA family protein n=1 Tax=Paenibacillus sp. N3.4 TaxID=2603222 RepID=UPI0011CA6B7C|nr:RraA family protein [Paenibacillus sp. N3.4]TXK79107.1 RraA family protein [Paenibacillus sp. N3.4]
MSNIIEQFQVIPTTCISDAMQGLNNLDPHIKPLKEAYQVAGRALTVKMPVGDNLIVLKAIREAKPGDILVIDAKGDDYRAVAGDFVVGMAMSLGIKGIIVDGVIRDLVGIKQLNFPVFSRGTTVQSGDIVVGDADGVVVIPQAIEEQVLRDALNKLDKDNHRAAQISGKPEMIIQYLDEIIGNG